VCGIPGSPSCVGGVKRTRLSAEAVRDLPTSRARRQPLRGDPQRVRPVIIPSAAMPSVAGTAGLISP
jgi:hypothetical protein